MYLTKIIKDWYRGKLIKGKCISNIKDGFPTQGNLPLLEIVLDRYEQPLLAKILKYIGQFWLRRWTVLFPIVVTIILTLFIYFDTKATREPQKKENDSINKTYIDHKDSK